MSREPAADDRLARPRQPLGRDDQVDVDRADDDDPAAHAVTRRRWTMTGPRPLTMLSTGSPAIPASDVGADEPEDAADRLRRRRGRVRGEQDPVRAADACVHRKGFGREDVDRGAGQVAALDQIDQRIEVDHAAAAGIDDDGPAWEQSEPFRVEQTARVVGQGEVDDEDLGRRRSRSSSSHPRHTGGLVGGSWTAGPVRDLAADAGEQPRHPAADRAEPDDAHPLPAELRAATFRELELRPAARP